MTRSQKKGRPAKMTLADLRPAQQITCMLCELTRSSEGAKPFHSHFICAKCQEKLPVGSAR